MGTEFNDQNGSSKYAAKRTLDKEITVLGLGSQFHLA